MAFDYASLRTIAAGLLADFGTSATLHRRALSGTAYDPTETITNHTITVLRDTDQVVDRSGTLIGQSRTVLYVAPGATEPQMGDSITLLGERVEVESVEPIQPGPTLLMWKVTLVG